MFDAIIARGEGAAESLSAEAVYAGFSLGALPAQKLAQTRPAARGAVLYHGGVPASTFAPGWPHGVPLQLHLMDHDEWSELDVVEELARTADDAELYVYPGSAHLFTDSSLGDYDRRPPTWWWTGTTGGRNRMASMPRCLRLRRLPLQPMAHCER